MLHALETSIYKVIINFLY